METLCTALLVTFPCQLQCYCCQQMPQMFPNNRASGCLFGFALLSGELPIVASAIWIVLAEFVPTSSSFELLFRF